MSRLLRKILGLHEHIWKEDERIPGQITYASGRTTEVTRVMCHCEICGAMRKFDL